MKKLSPREQQICDKLNTQPGLTKRGLGRQLGISRYTVDKYLRNIYSKAEVANRGELIAVLCRKEA